MTSKPRPIIACEALTIAGGEINDKLLTKEREAIRHLNSTSARCMAELRASELFRQQEFESRLSAEAAAELERFCEQLKLHSEDNRRIVSSDIDQLREVVLDEVSEILTAKGPCSAGGDDDRVSRQLDLFNRMIRTCLLYTSPSPRDLSTSRMPSSA